MAAVRVQFSQLNTRRNKEAIVASAFADPKFIKTVDRRIRNTEGARARSVAQSHTDQAVANIQQVLESGINGAAKGRKRISVKDVSGQTMNVPVDFKRLKIETLKHKRSNIGVGKFWLDTGGIDSVRPGLREVATSIIPPKVHFKTKLSPKSVRTTVSGASVAFEITLRFDKMNFPFDDMVRRPLVIGEFSEEVPVGGAVNWKDKTSVFLSLEYGYTNEVASAPARGFIRRMSAELGQRMFKRINRN